MEILKEKLAKELVEYAKKYMDEFKLYFNSPNRKNHFPYIDRVLPAGNDINNIKSLCYFNINPRKKAVFKCQPGKNLKDSVKEDKWEL